MNRHIESEKPRTDARESYERCGLWGDSPAECMDLPPGVTENSSMPDAGIPSGEGYPDVRDLVAERLLVRLVLDDKPRSRRAAAAVVARFAERNRLQIFRLGRTRLFRMKDVLRALERQSGRRVEGLLRRAAQ
jgi:hypothetical protein